MCKSIGSGWSRCPSFVIMSLDCLDLASVSIALTSAGLMSGWSHATTISHSFWLLVQAASVPAKGPANDLIESDTTGRLYSLY